MLKTILDDKTCLEIQELIDRAENIVLTCHVSPDGDAMGSMLALCNYLWKKGKNVLPVVPNIFPDFLNWLPGADKVRVYDKNEEELDVLIGKADLFFFMDFNTPSRMSAMENSVMRNNAPKIMIDHHLDPSDVCDVVISYPEMSSTCELLYRVFLDLDSIENISYDEAVCIYTGMMTDTGCFAYNSNRSEIYYIIAQLLTKGIDKDKIYRNVFYEYSADRFALMGYMLYVKMKQYPEHKAVIMTLTREEQKRFSHKKGDTEGFVNIPLQIKGTCLSILLREDTEKDAIRVSLRSVDDFPCNKMAEKYFNGGGHKNASGGELRCSMDEAEILVENAIKEFCKTVS